MPKEIWLGPVLGNNRERLLARCKEYLSADQTNRLLYIAASQPLLDLVTEHLLDKENTAGVWGEFPVYLFRGFVRRILSEAQRLGRAASTTEPSLTVGLLTRTPIDREEFPLRRSLISQIIKQLAATGQIPAIRPLAHRDGCVNTIASLIGELQRAGQTPQEFTEAISQRAIEDPAPKSKDQSIKSQADFDRDVALIYQTYTKALDATSLTDEDADQLRALQALREAVTAEKSTLPWLTEIELLVLDGFFDFTPVQGEILRLLIPQAPNVIVNLNYDQSNEEIFRPFQSTLERLKSIAEFDEQLAPIGDTRDPLPARLFNSDADTPAPVTSQIRYTLFECGDREVEMRSISKEIKRLVTTESYDLRDIALVVRERATYADTILRVMADESIPCQLQRRVEAQHVPALRACAKLFQLLREPDREQMANPKADDLGHLIKTDYFRLSPEALDELARDFDKKYSRLLQEGENQPFDKLRNKLGIGKWRPDEIENVIAYVGTELRTAAWIDRALKLIKVFPSAEDARNLIASGDAEDSAAVAEDEAPPPDEGAVMERRKRPAPIHPASIAWSVLLINRLRESLIAIAEEGTPQELRRSLMQLLDRLQFSAQINRPFHLFAAIKDLPQATLDVRGRESLRRAIAAATRSFEYARGVVSNGSQPGKPTRAQLLPGAALDYVHLSTFVDEVERCLRSQVLVIGAANRDGLRVLEATDVRGLRFRAIFVAGMIEGGFPLRTSGDWLYPHEERVRLQHQGIFLEDISTDTLLKEEHYFYQAACRATERLYLTRPLALEDGSETVASYYIEELRRAVAPANVEVKQFRADLDSRDLRDASTTSELSTFLVRQSEQPQKAQMTGAPASSLAIAGNPDTWGSRSSQIDLRELLGRAIAEGFVSPSALHRVAIEGQRSGPWFGPFDGEITNADLQAMLARHFGASHIFSASGLSAYGNCAFRFLGARVLRLEPRNEAALDLQSIDAGKLLHDILRRFFEQYRNRSLLGLDRQELREQMARTAEQVFKEHEVMVPPLNDRIWKIDCEIRKLILDQVLLYELRLQEKTDARGVRPRFFELAFGRASQAADPDSTSEFLKINRPQGDSHDDFALIQGQIDRVDVGDGGAVAYDYKLSRGAGLRDLETGRALQIPIYLAALEQLFLPSLNLAGGGYYILRARGARLNQGLYRQALADHTHLTYAKAKLDDLEWQRIRSETAKRVWEFIDAIRGGHFRVKPSLGRLTCKFCDYSAVCRFDAYRISRKRA